MANLTDTFTTASGNNILEEIQCVPDGRSITVGSGTYIMQNVDGKQGLTTTYNEILGSKINYTPPPGTKYIKYQYQFHVQPNSYSGRTHYRLYVDGSDVTEAMKSYSCQSYSSYGYANQSMDINYVFDLTALSTNVSLGKFSDWTSAKEICVKARLYSNTYGSTLLNGNTWRDGTSAPGTFSWNRPLLTITALS
jgi:hypothetical protein